MGRDRKREDFRPPHRGDGRLRRPRTGRNRRARRVHSTRAPLSAFLDTLPPHFGARVFLFPKYEAKLRGKGLQEEPS